MLLSFILPFPRFSGNHRNGYGKSRFYNTKAYNAYKIECFSLTRGLISSPISQKVEVSMFFFPPDNRRRDRSNYLKIIEDVLTFCEIWKDDSLAIVGHSYMLEKAEKPRVYIEISELEKINIDNSRCSIQMSYRRIG